MDAPAAVSVSPTTVEQVVAAVRAARRVLPRGGGTKPALSAPPPGVETLDLSGLAGVLEYDPAEFTFTALAGTPVAEVETLLARHGQYLPFDPPWPEAGATLGGTVGAGLSGPGRYRFGGVRDFLLGVQYVDGTGVLARAGGRVVKNAAGFDLPKLLTGSLGRLAVLVSLTFKVFPRPAAYATVRAELGTLAEAVAALVALTTTPLDLDALDLEPSGMVLVRIGGGDALSTRAARLVQRLGGGEILERDDDARLWRTAREFTWAPADALLAKVALTPRRLPALDAALAGAGAGRRYSAGGTVAWVAWPPDVPPRGLQDTLVAQGLAGLLLRGPSAEPRLGVWRGSSFGRRVKQALDPEDRFLELYEA